LFLVGTGSFAALVGAPGLLEGVETHAGVSSAVLDACGVAIEDERATSRRAPKAAVKRADASASLGAFGPYRLEEVVRGGPVFSTFHATHSVGGHTVWITMTPLSAEPSASAGLRLRAAATALAALGRGRRARADGRDSKKARGSPSSPRPPRGPSLRAIIDELSSLTGLDAEHRAALAVAFVRAVAEVNDAGVVHGALCPDSGVPHTERQRSARRFLGRDAARRDAQETPRDIPEAGRRSAIGAPSGSPERASTQPATCSPPPSCASRSSPGATPSPRSGRGRAWPGAIRTADPSPSLAGELLDEVLLKGLQKIPTLRHESAARLADDLTAALGGPSRLTALSAARSLRACGGARR
jgi:hypothetical protein